MREIKYKVWDTLNNTFLDETVEIMNTCINSFSKGRLIFFQFTHCKDIMDKEIYDGDIVKIDFGWIFEIYEVQWGHYGDGEYVSNVECWSAGRYPISDGGGLYGTSAYTLEVIGNIYENPELLKEKK